MGKPARNCCSHPQNFKVAEGLSPQNVNTPDVKSVEHDVECNGHSVHLGEELGTQAVRQHFHNNGASAGICVEDLHESDLNKRGSREQRPCIFNSRYRYEKKDEDGANKGQNPEYTDFWRLLHGKHSAFEAIGLSGAIALCVELSHYTCIGKVKRTEDRSKEGCLLRKLASSFHTLGGHTFCPVNRILPEGSVCGGHTPLDVSVGDPLQGEIPSHAEPAEADPSLYFTDLQPTTECLKEEKRFAFYDFPHRNAKSTPSEPEARKCREKSERVCKSETNDSIQADASVHVTSVEEAYAEFEEICKKYTGIGKGIMGNQAAMRGNLKSAASLWTEATSLGHSKSFYNLALCYEHGKGVEQNIAEAIRLYKHAVKEGHLQAMYNLAMLYMDGTDQSHVDTNRAVKLMTTAAEQGLIEAQKYLGVYYSETQQENSEKAAQFMKMAADQQDAESQYYMAMFNEHGYGVDRNTCKAVYLYNKAAESGHSEAMYSLALYHLEGAGGLPQDKHCAQRLLEKSANSGNKQAQNKLLELDRLHSTDTDDCHSTKNNLTSDISYLLRLSSTVSTPCLSELVRESFKQVRDKIMYDPVSDAGTVSQIYTQLMIPRGLTLVPSTSQLSNVSESYLDDDGDSDSGVVFQIGRDCDVFDHEEDVEDDGIYFDHTNGYERMNSKMEYSASMPDMMMLAC